MRKLTAFMMLVAWCAIPVAAQSLGHTDITSFNSELSGCVTVDPSNAFGIRIVTADAWLDGNISLTFNGITVALIDMDHRGNLGRWLVCVLPGHHQRFSHGLQRNDHNAG